MLRGELVSLVFLMISVDSLHGLFVSLARALIADVSGHTLNVADTFHCSLIDNFNFSKVSVEYFAYLFSVLVDLIVTQACTLGTSIKWFIALICQLACTIGELL